MTVYFQISELADVASYQNLQHTTNYTVNGNTRISIGARSDQGNNDTDSWFKGPSFSATNMWLHFNCISLVPYWGSPSTAYLANQSMVKFMAGGTKRFRLIHILNVTPQIIQLDKWDGAAWTTIGSYSIIYGQQPFSDNVHTYDVHMPIGPSVNVEVYMDNNVIIAVSGVDTTFGGTVTAIDDIYFSNCAGNGAYTYYSEIICADWNTVGSKVVVRVPDSNGLYAEWTNGDYTVVDEITGGTDYATSPTADQRVDWSMTNFPNLASNEVIPYVKVNAMVNRDIVGPQNMNFYTARAGLAYHGNDQSLTTSQTAKSEVYTVDPATGDIWSVSNLNATTFGIRSRT